MLYKCEAYWVIILLLIPLQCCVYIVPTQSTWSDAMQKCAEHDMNLAGTAEFYNHHTGKYVPKLSDLRVTDHELLPAWIHGYVQRTIWISQDGCYQVTNKNLIKFSESYVLKPNGPKECSLKCGKTVFALQTNRCFCLQTIDSKFLTNTTSVTMCSEYCSGDSVYYCGAAATLEGYNHLSVYRSLHIRRKFPDTKNCLAMSLYSNGEVGRNCEEKSNCFCKNHLGHNLWHNLHIGSDIVQTSNLPPSAQTFSGAYKIGKLVYQSVLESWERCNIKCREYGAEVLTIDNSNKNSLPLQFNVWYLNGYFRFVTQIWDKPMESEVGEISGCLAITMKGSKLQFVTRNCSLSLPAVCETKNKVNQTENLENGDEDNTRNVLFGMIIGGVLILVIVTAVILYICKRKRGYICFGTTGWLCFRKSRRKNLGSVPAASDLDRGRQGSGRHIYTYIDPDDIMPLRNIYEDIESCKQNEKLNSETVLDKDPNNDIQLDNDVQPDTDIKQENHTKSDNDVEVNSSVQVDSEGYLEPAKAKSKDGGLTENPRNEASDTSDTDNRNYDPPWR